MSTFTNSNFGNTGDTTKDMQNYKIELERKLRHLLNNIDVTNIILGLSSSRLVSTSSTGKLESVSNLTDWINGTLNQIIVTANSDGTVTLSLPQNINTNSDVEFDNVKLNDLTANRLTATDVNKKIVSIETLYSWIKGTTNQINVIDELDGSIKLILPQSINTISSPTFANLTITGNNVKINTKKTPSSETDTGTKGAISWDSDYMYICIATDTWRRVPLSTWSGSNFVVRDA